MKLKLEFDDDGVIHDVMDSVFVALLNRALSSATASHSWDHPDDVAMQLRVAEASRVLIDYYGEPND
jgi:hypothetical protein